MAKNPLNDADHDGQSLGIQPPETTKEKYYNQYGLRHKDYRFKDFEDYLMTVFAEGDGATVLDDNFPDSFNDWLEQIDIDDIIRFGTIYGNICKEYKNGTL